MFKWMISSPKSVSWLLTFSGPQRFEDMGWRHWQNMHANIHSIVDGIGYGRWRGHDRYLTRPAHAVRVARVGNFYNHGLDGGHIRTGGDAAIEVAAINQADLVSKPCSHSVISVVLA